MNSISIYGKPSYSYDVLKGRIIETLNSAKLGIALNEFNSVKVFIDENIDSIPAISIDNEIRTIGKSKLEDFASEVQRWILKTDSKSQKIVAGIDLGTTSKNVLTYLINLSKKLGIDLEVVHACHPTIQDSLNISWEETLRRKEIELNQRLNDVRINEKESLNLKARIIQGLAGDVLSKIGLEEKSLILVVGSNPSSKNFKSMLGSVSLSTIKNSKEPVIILPNDLKTSKLEKVAFAAYDIEKDKDSFLKLSNHFGNNFSEIHCITFDNPSYNQEELRSHVLELNPGVQFVFEHLKGSNLLVSINSYCDNQSIDLLASTKLDKSFFQKVFETSFTKELSLDPLIPLLILH